MENRDRDKVSRSTEPTDAGKVNRDVAARRGQEEHSGGADFGRNIGEAENLEPNTRHENIKGGTGSDQTGSTGKGNGSGRGEPDSSGRSEGNH